MNLLAYCSLCSLLHLSLSNKQAWDFLLPGSDTFRAMWPRLGHVTAHLLVKLVRTISLALNLLLASLFLEDLLRQSRAFQEFPWKHVGTHLCA